MSENQTLDPQTPVYRDLSPENVTTYHHHNGEGPWTSGRTVMPATVLGAFDDPDEYAPYIAYLPGPSVPANVDALVALCRRHRRDDWAWEPSTEATFTDEPVERAFLAGGASKGRERQLIDIARSAVGSRCVLYVSLWEAVLIDIPEVTHAWDGIVVETEAG